MRVRAKPRVAVVYNRDFEGAEADPENKAREDIKTVVVDVMRVLGSRGHEVRAIGVGEDVNEVMVTLREMAPSAIFNLCESLRGDNRFEALLPLLFELDGLVYTGTGPLGLSLALHKHKAKEILQGRGIPTPRGRFVESVDARLDDLRFPVIVKPTREDASVGISSASVVNNVRDLEARVRFVLSHYCQPALVEEYIDGREINVSLLERPGGGPEVLPLYEIDFSAMPADRPRIVSFEGKWVEQSPEYQGTAPVLCQDLTPEVRARIVETARAAFDALNLRDYGRVDVRLSSEGVPYVIDVNPNCDLSEASGGFARAARAAGLSYEDVVLRLLTLALNRRRDADTIPLSPRSGRPDRDPRAEDGQPVSTRGGFVRPRAP